jgi:hypothetical protein
MSIQPDFDIQAAGNISKEFIKRSIFTFAEAALFVRQLPYGRNADKYDAGAIFANNCGTCSTKHALLKSLAAENGTGTLKLFIGIYKMNGTNTPAVAATLLKHGLAYIPEAHCYLKHNGHILDYTKANAKAADFADDLLEEIEILPEQITDFKVACHKNYIAAWLSSNRQITFTPAEVWAIREQCIKALSA